MTSNHLTLEKKLKLKFNDPKITVSINDEEYDQFLNLAEKL